jgi:lysophospholipase L1-like esterase
MVGSSIFKRWTTAATDFAPLPIINRAFGGSRTIDQLVFFEQIVPSSKASLVVWYCGSNDINGKVSPENILTNTSEWLLRTRKALPDAGVVLLSVIRAPQKRNAGYLTQVDETNSGLKKLAESLPHVTYVDENPALETPTGEAEPEYYVEDKLHLNAAGYAKMTTVLLPVLQKEWKSSTSSTSVEKP